MRVVQVLGFSALLAMGVLPFGCGGDDEDATGTAQTTDTGDTTETTDSTDTTDTGDTTETTDSTDTTDTGDTTETTDSTDTTDTGDTTETGTVIFGHVIYSDLSPNETADTTPVTLANPCTVTVTLRDTSLMDAPSVELATRTYEGVTTLPLAYSLDVEGLDLMQPEVSISAYVDADASGDRSAGDYYTTWSHSIPSEVCEGLSDGTMESFEKNVHVTD